MNISVEQGIHNKCQSKKLIVSLTRRRRDIEIPLCLSAFVQKKLIRKSAIFGFQFVKPILQTNSHLKQYAVLKIQFWSVKCVTFTMRYAKISSISIPSHQAMQAIAMVRLRTISMKTNHFKMVLNIFSIITYKNLFKLYSIFVLLKIT